jgi:DNA-directed RNA polymerase specialized sigma24 family protein
MTTARHLRVIRPTPSVGFEFVELGLVADLVVRARDGDQDAWEALVDRYLAMVHAVCRGYQLGAEEAATVNQVVWLRLAEHLGRIRSPEAVGGWIAATTRNECTRMQRAGGGPAVVEGDGVLGTLGSGGANGANGADGAGRRGDGLAGIDLGLLVYERDRALMAAFAGLDDRGQKLLRLLMTEPPPSYAEIGAALDMPVGSIEPTRARYLDQLRRMLG